MKTNILIKSSDSPEDTNYEQPSINFEDSNLDHRSDGAPENPDHVGKSQRNQYAGPTQGSQGPNQPYFVMVEKEPPQVTPTSTLSLVDNERPLSTTTTISQSLIRDSSSNTCYPPLS